MNIVTKENLDLAADIAAILTAIVAVVFYIRSLGRRFYLNDLPGTYKIFSGLKSKENATALYEIKITYVSNRGWFYGILQYSEVYEHPNSRSGGLANVFGKIDYSYLRIIYSYLWHIVRLKCFNPLETTDFGSFHGTIYLLSRNDLDISKRSWREMITQEYDIIHYRDAHRFKLFNPKRTESYLQLPDELVLVNIDKIPDPMLDTKI